VLEGAVDDVGDGLESGGGAMRPWARRARTPLAICPCGRRVEVAWSTPGRRGAPGSPHPRSRSARGHGEHGRSAATARPARGCGVGENVVDGDGGMGGPPGTASTDSVVACTTFRRPQPKLREASLAVTRRPPLARLPAGALARAAVPAGDTAIVVTSPGASPACGAGTVLSDHQRGHLPRIRTTGGWRGRGCGAARVALDLAVQATWLRCSPPADDRVVELLAPARRPGRGET